MAHLKEKEKIEKEELRMKAKIEKEQMKERTRLEEEEKRRSKDNDKGLVVPLIIATEGGTAPRANRKDRLASRGKSASTGSSEPLKDSSDENDLPARDEPAEEETIVSPASPSKRQSKVKSWFAGRFRSSSKPAKDDQDGDAEKSGFIGGASLTGATSTLERGEDSPREESVRDTAVAGKLTSVHKLVTDTPTDPVSPVNDTFERNALDNKSISSLSNNGEDFSGKKEPHRGRLGFKDRLLGKTRTRTSDDTDNEEFEEARDTFEEDKLAPPPKLTATGLASKASASPVRDSRFSENL